MGNGLSLPISLVGLTMARIVVTLQPEQIHLQEQVMELSNDAQHMMPRDMSHVARISLPVTVDTQRLDNLGVEWKEVSPGRPSFYPDRKRSSLEMSPEVWEEIERLRGGESRAVFIEQCVRKALGMPSLEPLK